LADAFRPRADDAALPPESMDAQGAASSSIGDVYFAKPDKQLIDELRKACEQIATERDN
jgi:hypothetical protein